MHETQAQPTKKPETLATTGFPAWMGDTGFEPTMPHQHCSCWGRLVVLSVISWFMYAWTALALAERDEVHLRPEAQETLKDIRWAIGEAVE